MQHLFTRWLRRENGLFASSKLQEVQQLFPEFPESDVTIHRTQLTLIFRIGNKYTLSIKDTVALRDKPSLVSVLFHPAEYLFKIGVGVFFTVRLQGDDLRPAFKVFQRIPFTAFGVDA